MAHQTVAKLRFETGSTLLLKSETDKNFALSGKRKQTRLNTAQQQELA